MKIKRMIALMLVFIMAVVLVPLKQYKVYAVSQETKLIVHFKPEDKKDWNLWVWPKDGEGKVYKFTDEDSYGKVAEVILPGIHKEVGFIVRTDAWDKVGSDRMVDTSRGIAEVWVDKEKTLLEPPSKDYLKKYDTLNVNFHYKRLDNNYEGWNLWAWPKDGEGKEVTFTKEDDFGKVATINVKGTDLTSIGYIIRKSTKDNPWSDKDIDKDRFITIFDSKGNVDVWVVSGDMNTYYNPFFAITTPKIVSAMMDEANLITVKTNKDLSNVDLNDVSIDKGNIVSVDKVDATTLKIKTKERIDFKTITKVSIKGFESANVTLGNYLRSSEFDKLYGTDEVLGQVYSKDKTTLRLWAPTASKVELLIYEDVKEDSKVKEELQMRDNNGTWSIELKGDRNNTAYAYKVTFPDNTTNISQDPYAIASVVNGERSVILDTSKTNPENFTRKEPFTKNEDALIYEAHVRDFSIDKSSGMKNKGKYLAFTENGTVNDKGESTGVDYLKKLGITHVQLLPIFDYASVNEASNEAQYNWGYDPKNYNVPEGSYSTNAFDPQRRIIEMKQMIKSLHENGLRVIMDVVYNHVYQAANHPFEKVVPGYYFRYDKDGKYANGTGVGNETASERRMMRKFIVDSVKYWTEEYKLDGFRFDLMGIHDKETMNEVRGMLNNIDKSIITLGEGWNMGNLKEDLRATQKNAKDMPNIAHFNDSLRDAVKGSVFNSKEGGFVQGVKNKENLVMDNLMGADKLSDNIATYTSPLQVVQYVEAHDNLTLFDKLMASVKDAKTIKDRHNLATSMVVLSQGMPFIHAGQEFLRTKNGNENSYNAGDNINKINWNRMTEEKSSVEFFKNLVNLRKSDNLFRMTSYEEINKNMKPLIAKDGVVSYSLGDKYIITFNSNEKEFKQSFNGEYLVLAEGNKFLGDKKLVKNETKVMPLSVSVLKKADKNEITPPKNDETKPINNDNKGKGKEKDMLPNTGETNNLVLPIVGGVLLLAGVALVFIKSKGKKPKNKRQYKIDFEDDDLK